MYSPYARSLLTKLLKDAHEDEDEAMARTFEQLASDPRRWPEVRDFFLADQKEWPDIANRASRAADVRLERMVMRGEVQVREEDERIEAQTFYQLLAEHHVHANPDAEMLCLIHKPRFPRRRRRKTAYEHVHGERPGESPLSEVASSDDEGGSDDEESPPPCKGQSGKKRLIVIMDRSESGGAGEGAWERLAREAREGMKRKHEYGGEGEVEEPEKGPRKWKKAKRVVRAEDRAYKDDDEQDDVVESGPKKWRKAGSALRAEIRAETDDGDEDEDSEENGEAVDAGPRMWTKAGRVVGAGKRADENDDDYAADEDDGYENVEEEDFEDVWMDEFEQGPGDYNA